MLRFLLAALLILAAPAQAAEEEHSLRFAGHDRPYIVHMPPGYNTDLSHPAIIALHGAGGNGAQFMQASGLNDAADKAGMLAVYPSGYPGRRIPDMRTWNAGHCCAGAVAAGSDDTAYLRAVIDDLPRHYNVDRERIYVTGYSNGAMMAYRLSCELADRIAAIAPVGGQGVMRDCAPSRAIPILHIHGTADNCAIYEGGRQCGGCFAARLRGKAESEIEDSDRIGTWPCDPVPESMAKRAALYQCAADAIPDNGDSVPECVTWKGCRDEAHITLCSLPGAGHVWPGDAAAAIVSFFQSVR